jgi:hypothetical protein
VRGLLRWIAEKLGRIGSRRRGGREDAPAHATEEMSQRLGQLEERLKEIEEAMGADSEEPDITGEVVSEAEGPEPSPLTETEEVLAKAQEAGGADVTDETVVEVRRGIPLGIPGQQARRKTARLWEGVV